jgi:hypothetical protein
VCVCVCVCVRVCVFLSDHGEVWHYIKWWCRSGVTVVLQDLDYGEVGKLARLCVTVVSEGVTAVLQWCFRNRITGRWGPCPACSVSAVC